MSTLPQAAPPSKPKPPRLPEEVCEQCGKTISRKAIANVFDGRILCTACWRPLNRARAEQEARAAAAKIPASEAQLRYATEGRLDRPRPATLQAEARNLGMEPEGMPGRVFDEMLRERQLAQRWAYSVCRHARGAEWLEFIDSGIRPRELIPVVTALASDPALMDALWETDDGEAPLRFDDACYERGIQGAPWFFFGRGGASPRSTLYARTRELIAEALPGRLPG
jgi:hypothetical protein